MSKKMLILYGTETGNSELLAMDADKLAQDNDFDTTVNGMDEVTVDDLKGHDNLIVRLPGTIPSHEYFPDYNLTKAG